MRLPVLCQLVMYPRAHAHAKTHTRITVHTLLLLLSPALFSVFFLSFMLQEFLVQIRPFAAFCVVPSTLCYGYDITPVPHGVLCAYMVDSKTLEVYHTAQQRLRGLLGQSHIQASAVFYVPPLPFYGKTLTILFSLLWGRVGGGEGEWMVGAVLCWGQFVSLEIVITLGYW